jgi:hypothetical protein
MERCGRCGVEVGEVPEVVWWCWWCGRALCESCGGSDTATCGLVPRTCDQNPRRVSILRPRYPTTTYSSGDDRPKDHRDKKKRPPRLSVLTDCRFAGGLEGRREP